MTYSKKNKINLIILAFIIVLIIAFSSLFFSKKNTTPLKVSLVNTKIIESSDQKYSYMNSNINFQAFFPQNIFDLNSNIKFEQGNSSLTFNLLPISKNQKNITPKIDQNQIYYPKIYENGSKFIDLRYSIFPDKLVEEIILNKLQDLPKISQRISLFNSYLYQDGSQLNFLNPANNQLLWFIPAPFMYEKNNPSRVNYGLKYEISCDDSKTELKNCRQLTLTKVLTEEGKKWLSDPNRKYPVIIDPTLQINGANTATQWISSNTNAVVVSQETIDKVEGTGSVKVVVGTNSACWSLGGTCDTDCHNTAVTPANVFSTCTPSNCANTNTWTIAGVEDTACDYPSLSTGTAYDTCTASSCDCWQDDTATGTCDSGCTAVLVNSTSRYQTCTKTSCNCWGISNVCDTGCVFSTQTYASFFFSGCSGSTIDASYLSGTCSTSGTCYKGSGTINSWQLVGSCLSKQVHTTQTACTRYGAVGNYTVSSAATHYSSAGACDQAPPLTGTCRKLVTPDATWSSSNTACNASTCNGYSAAGYYDTYHTCSVITRNSYTGSTPVTTYTGVGTTCSPTGSGTCYKLGSPVTKYTGNTACTTSGTCPSGSVITTNTACTWTPLQQSWTASVGTTRYTGNGTACSGTGTGSCYAMNPDATNTYTGNTACGSATCAGEAVRNTFSTCSWLSGNNSVGLTQSPQNLSQATSITFWVKSVGLTGSGFLTFGIGETGNMEQSYAISINAANTWEQKTWDISALSTTAKDQITRYTFSIGNTGFTFYFDDIQANYTNANAPPTCVIDQGKNNSTLTLKWLNNGVTKNYYSLFKQTDGGAFVSLSTLPSTATTFPDTNVSSGHTYSYQLKYYTTVVGTTVASDVCTFPTLSLGSGGFKFDGVNLDGLNLN